MEKRKIWERKIVYGTNTAIKYIKTDGRNKDYIYVQHKHEDYEVRIILSGGGKCFIGDHVIEYTKGDILFIGRNVPHCSSLSEPPPGDEHNTESDVLLFSPDLLPSNLDNLPDYIHINNLLLKSQNGLLFRERGLFRKVKEMTESFEQLKGIERITVLFSLLELLGKNKHANLVSKEKFNAGNHIYVTHESLQKTYDYLYNHMKEPVTLEAIAAYVSQNPASLCRSFKQKTGITIFQFLNKIRIENACKLLTYTDLNISQIAYESGFNNMPHFNRQFKLITHLSPSQYRNQIEMVVE